MERATHFCRALLACTLLSLLSLDPACSSALHADEEVIFVPSTARFLDDGQIEARIEAWVFELEDRPGLNGLFAKHLQLNLETLPIADRQRFLSRTQLFRVDSESFKQLMVGMDGYCCTVHPLTKTNFAGRSSTRIILAAGDPTKQWVRLSLQMRSADPRQFRGRALLVPKRGLSVISDIDDTIKISQVRDRRALLLNTFLNPFVAAPGMVERYSILAKEPDVAFHYVSSSPIQLYPPLRRFLRQSGFPAGSVHLRESTSFLNLIAKHGDSRTHKLDTIHHLLSDFPERQFLLIGDSGEADPEIYGEIARGYRDQIIGIQIRDVSGEDADSPRYRSAFLNLPAELWQVFRTRQSD